ncbi:E3 ISG15--protein ligase HERC5-like isoform X2 [Sphaerodactylus townsendi]|uniref:E3 ISG15--protein ligase HERC5-like isoform X2 n=1 Tax=Sphaerodactylus townsendi TaxID=933632 RepID=UPI0020267D17|nr:E3 ISG15--protein ligase HERC5-like isoform X2 [Sphaerodactylus townsendi]
MPKRRAPGHGPSSGAPLPPLLFFPKAPFFREDLGNIRQISCKRGCLSAVRTDGTVVVWVGAEKGGDPQSHPRSPRRIKLKKNVKVNSVDCETSHLLILSSEGKLSEHSVDFQNVKSQPRLLKELGDKQMVQIACGDHHSMALSKGGQLFSWGQNDYGQLGLGGEMTSSREPQRVQALDGIPLAHIAAGGSHSLAVSLSGSVYSWGKNAFGQLGLGHTEDKYFPTYVNALEHKKTVFISCGGEHTAILTKDGLVCTFGAGCYGQLGHNSTCNEVFPRFVAELFSVRVSEVACGRWHTLVYVEDLWKVYAFGSGSQGQLGSGRTCNQLIPLPVDLTEKGRKSKQEGSASEEKIKVIAGDNQSILLFLKKKNSYASINQTLARIEEEEIDKWISDSDPNCWRNKRQDIRLIFSSVACINGSFLNKSQDEHFRTSQEASGINMSAVLLFSDKIAKNPKVCTEVTNAVKKLVRSQYYPATSPEALRVFLILSVILRKQDHLSDWLLLRLAQIIMDLETEDRQTLESLWSSLDIPFFKDLVDIYQRLSSDEISFIIEEMRNSEMVDNYWDAPFLILQVLYEVNSRTGFKIQEKNFYVPEVKYLLHFPIDNLQQVFTEAPCILDMEAKILLHDLNRRVLHCMFSWLDSPNVQLLVRRQYLVQDTWVFLRNMQVCQFLLFLQVPSEEDVHFLIGNIFGMALYNKKIAAFPFPLALFKKMLNVPLTLEDLKELSPTEGRCLQAVLDEQYDDILESMMLDFTVLKEEGGSKVSVELKKNGANIAVTKYNRKEYVDAYVNYVFNDSVKEQFKNFLDGFLRGCQTKKWKVFLPTELRLVLLGHTNYNWEQLEKNALYDGYEKSDETIKNFWAVFHDLPEEKKKDFLAFLTGTNCIPGKGMERFVFTIVESRKEDPDKWYPSACTCFRYLRLPRYSNQDVLREMFLFALEHYEKFGLS